MGLLNFILRLFGIGGSSSHQGENPKSVSSPQTKTVAEKSPLPEPEPYHNPLDPPADEHQTPGAFSSVTRSLAKASKKIANAISKPGHSQSRIRVKLQEFEYTSNLIPTPTQQELTKRKPYLFAKYSTQSSCFLDLSQDSDERWLDHFNLPHLKTPQDLANWLEVPLGQLAWLANQSSSNKSSQSRNSRPRQSHYHYHVINKRSGGFRLIEAPKQKLKEVQGKILCGILDSVPVHDSAHAFVAGRSILTNVEPHVHQKMVLHMDLRNFYPNVKISRVVAIFRSLGYSREVALWLGALTTNKVPWGVKLPDNSATSWSYYTRHLPQGAPTSPALANLSAYSLDVRLSGLARSYQMEYTRYADDMTFSGSGTLYPALREIIPLIKAIIRNERFQPHSGKQQVLRPCFRQKVTGIVINEKLNVDRREFDRLKATLHNCRKLGPSTQKRDVQKDFYAHLQGRIAHIRQINPARAEKLQNIFNQINWSR